MMTLGRLRAIESFWHLHAEARDGVAVKHTNELIAEVHRLRAVLALIGMESADGPATVLAIKALHEPDIGPPDLIHRSST